MANTQYFLKIGQLVNIEVVESKGSAKRYPSRVEGLDEDTVTLTSPLQNRVPVYLPAGSSVNIWCRDSLAAYTFSASVVQNKKERLPLLVITKPEKVKRVQMRAFVRVICNISVLLKYKDKAGNEEKLQCVSRDISAGGIMLILKKRAGLNKNDDVSVQFELNGDEFELSGKIIRNDRELDCDGIERTVLAIKFVELDSIATAKITKYVYQRQIELRKKGLL